MGQLSVFTIGHSNHSIEKLIGLLELHSVTAVADVRSSPYSRYNPVFNRENLKRSLKEAGIGYVFLGEELGARSKDPSAYREGRVQYRELAKTDLFKAGLDRVMEGASNHRVTLLCAEKEPLECHRTILVSRELESQGVVITHIHADGHLESHDEAMSRLLEMLRMFDSDLFRTREEMIADACDRQEQRIAFVEPETDSAQREGE